MPTTALYTEASEFRRVLATNSTASAFVVPADVVADPTFVAVDSAAGYIDFGFGTQNVSPNTVMFKFYGTDASDETGACRVYGVRPYRTADGKLGWTHTLLCGVTFTLSAATGVSGGAVGASEYYADTIERVFGIENVSDQILSPTDSAVAHLLVDMKGHRYGYVELIKNTAASVNALYAGV